MLSCILCWCKNYYNAANCIRTCIPHSGRQDERRRKTVCQRFLASPTHILPTNLFIRISAFALRGKAFFMMHDCMKLARNMGKKCTARYAVHNSSVIRGREKKTENEFKEVALDAGHSLLAAMSFASFAPSKVSSAFFLPSLLFSRFPQNPFPFPSLVLHTTQN